MIQLYTDKDFDALEGVFQNLEFEKANTKNRYEYLHEVYELMTQHYVKLREIKGYLELRVKDVKTKKGRFELGITLEQGQEEMAYYEKVGGYIKQIEACTILCQSIAKSILD